MSRNKNEENFLAKRFVFNGATAEKVFHEEILSRPEIENGEILVEILCSSICLSDVHTVTGQRTEPTPSVLGHEAVGKIVAHRRDDEDLVLGERITFSIVDSCGICEFCSNGFNQKCRNLFKYGHSKVTDGTGFNGCYASHIVLRRGTFVVKIPEKISDRCAAPINCALATSICAIEFVPKVKNGRAFVQGDGMLGLCCCAALNELGFEKIFCSALRERRSPFIERFGATALFSDEFPEDEANKIDVVIEVCGAPSVINDGIRLLKPGGIYIFVGMVHPHSKLEITGEQIIRKCLTIKGIHNYANRHLEEAVRFLEKTIEKYPFDELISPPFELSRLPEAMELAKKRTFNRVLIEPKIKTEIQQ